MTCAIYVQYVLFSSPSPTRVSSEACFDYAWSFTAIDIREVKIDVYDRPVTANAKLQVGFSGEVLAVPNLG